VTCAVYCPDGKHIISGGAHPSSDPDTSSVGVGELKVWDGNTGTELRSVPAQAGAVTHIACSPDGRRVFAVRGQQLHVWDGVPAGASQCLKQLTNIDGSISPWNGDPSQDTLGCIALSRDGDRLVWAGGDFLRVTTTRGDAQLEEPPVSAQPK
jgi:WD40 repeat protein